MRTRQFADCLLAMRENNLAHHFHLIRLLSCRPLRPVKCRSVDRYILIALFFSFSRGAAQRKKRCLKHFKKIDEVFQSGTNYRLIDVLSVALWYHTGEVSLKSN